MNFIDILLYFGIAITYNILVHNFASMTYKDLQYKDKHQNTIIMLIIFGVLGILISKLMDEKYKSFKNSYVSNGLYYGGVLLILTAVFANWEFITTEMKFFFIIALFGILLWYSYKRENVIKKEQEINEKIIDDLINE